MIIVILNAGSAGKFDPAFRTRPDKVRHLPDEIREAEMRPSRGDRHVANGGLTGLEFALELKRREHLSAPVRMGVGPGGQNHSSLAAHFRRFGPGVWAEPLLRTGGEQGPDSADVKIETASPAGFARGDVDSAGNVQLTAVEVGVEFFNGQLG